MLGWYDLLPMALYLGGLIAIGLFGLFRRDRTQENLILAGRRLTLPAFVASLVSTWYGGILGVGEFSYRHGLSNWLAFGVPYYLAAAIFALFLAGRARKSMALTIPDRLYTSYGAAASVAGSTILVLVTLPIANALMTGMLLHQFLGLPIWIGIIAAVFFSIFHVAAGGFAAVVWSDILQFSLMFAGFIVLFFYSLFTLGGVEYLQTRLPPAHFSATGGNPVGYIAIWYVIAMGTLVDPAFYQRCFASRSVSVARRGIWISILFWIVFDFMTTSCGLYARALLPQLENPAAAYPELAKAILPAGILGIFLLSILATVMSTVDSYIFLTATTISHDLFWRFKKFEDNRIRFYTMIGLTISGIATIAIALSSESVVNIWHDFGSIGTPALLLPLLVSYWGNRPYSPRGALLSIVLSTATVILALAWPRLSGAGRYLWEIEPIFWGLAVSVMVYLLTGRRKNLPAH
ncbi:MAG: sodium:solute symporter family protein [candidate division Zixibacteria bacterium]|nr:sodium:solute symporter family protein [candidate division Zixibacteria bacterium]